MVKQKSTLIGQASSVYNKHGIHLELINWRTTSIKYPVIVYYCFLLWCRMNIKVEKLKLVQEAQLSQRYR